MMSSCVTENWTLSDLSNALLNKNKDNKRIVVPMFQRGKRWKTSQEDKFIDSLLKGYPVGTMLFYETFEENKRTYILVDGLQRGNCIRKYILHPISFISDYSIFNNPCQKIYEILNINDAELKSSIRKILIEFVKKSNKFINLQFYPVANDIIKILHDENKTELAKENLTNEILEIMDIFFEELQRSYQNISNTVIPIIIYSGDENNLPDIFDRINSQGTALDKYEVFAASWPISKKYEIKNDKIVEKVIEKYNTLKEEDYFVYGYDRENMRNTKQLNAFEYMFGLGKFLVDKYEILSFNKNLKEDTVNPISFELINACLNDSDRIAKLYGNFIDKDLNLFETSLCNAINFVNEAVSSVTKFKGNRRANDKIFHSKYQILSMISTTFKEMYKDKYILISDNWKNQKSNLSNNLLKYYIYDIIINYWSNGGTSKIYSDYKNRRYFKEISGEAWNTALDSFYFNSMERVDKKKIRSPKSEEYVFLNCLYLNNFTAKDQLSSDHFDVEHIVPKEQIKQLIEKCNGPGLPISCIANLCYLPENVNRSKKAKNFYQDKRSFKDINLYDIERKFSFTEDKDLDWMDLSYESTDFEKLKNYYLHFCQKRFVRIKKIFLASLNISFVEQDIMIDEIQKKDFKNIPINSKNDIISNSKKQKNVLVTSKFSKKDVKGYKIICKEKIEKSFGLTLLKQAGSKYISEEDNDGYIILVANSKLIKNGNEYWFSYRRQALKHLEICKKQYIVFGCKGNNRKSLIFRISVAELEDKVQNERFNVSYGGKEKIQKNVYFQIYFHDYNDGRIFLHLTNPKEDISAKKYLI